MTGRLLRRAGGAALALALLAGACSDDAARGRSSTTTDAGPAPADLLRVPVEGRPAAVAFDGDWLYVADDAASAPDPGSVGILSPTTGATDRSVAVGPGPVALVPIVGAVWAIGATGVMTMVDTSLDSLTEQISVDLQGALVDGVIAGGRLWVGDIGRGEVFVLDPATGKAVADPVVVADGVVRLAVAGDRIWVSGTEDQLTPIDVATATAGDPVGVGTAPIGMAVTGGVLWVANSDDGTVSRLDAATGAPLGDPIRVGHAPIAIVIVGSDVWVLNQDDPSLTRLHADGAPVGAPIHLPLRPRGMASTPAGVWVVGVNPSSAVRIARQ